MRMDSFSDKTKELAHIADILLLPDIHLREGINRAFQPDTLSFYKYAKKKSKDLELALFENEGEVRTLQDCIDNLIVLCNLKR